MLKVLILRSLGLSEHLDPLEHLSYFGRSLATRAKIESAIWGWLASIHRAAEKKGVLGNPLAAGRIDTR